MSRGLALLNADVWTLDPRNGHQEAVLVEDGRIRLVGEERTVARRAHTAGHPSHDCQGLTLLPGLIDSHCHLVHQGLLEHRVDLRNTRSKSEALERVRKALPRHRGPAPLLAERWDESRWKERSMPTRADLDALSRKVPIILRRIDGHFAVGNALACELLKDRVEGVDPETGHLVEEASLNLNQVFPSPPAQVARAIRSAQARALELGVTGVHDFVVRAYLRGYAAAHRAGALRLRVRATPYVESLDALVRTGLPTGFGDDQLQLGGVKVFADGSLGGHTAALGQAYEDAPGDRGRLNWGDATLRGFVEAAVGADLQPSIHAIGDAAIDQVLGAYEQVPAAARRRLRPRIEHFELHTAEHVRRARRLGVVLSMQPNFVGEWSRPGGLYAKRLGRRRCVRNNEFRRIVDAGARLAFGSDCMPLDPWFGLHGCVHAPYPGQRLRLEEALRAYTAGSAWGLGWERTTGALRPGLRADLALVAADWKRADGIRNARVEATMVDGAWAFRRRR